MQWTTIRDACTSIQDTKFSRIFFEHFLHICENLIIHPNLPLSIFENGRLSLLELDHFVYHHLFFFTKCLSLDLPLINHFKYFHQYWTPLISQILSSLQSVITWVVSFLFVRNPSLLLVPVFYPILVSSPKLENSCCTISPYNGFCRLLHQVRVCLVLMGPKLLVVVAVLQTPKNGVMQEEFALHLQVHLHKRKTKTPKRKKETL